MSTKRKMLSPDPAVFVPILRSMLKYEADTGIFRWIRQKDNRFIGQVAGGINNLGYRKISVGGIYYKAHRLAWVYHYGQWPEMELDHINGARDDNRICNLRQVTRHQNCMNMSVWSSKDLPKGVSRSGSMFRARIREDGRERYLGSFKTVEDARKAYNNAAAAYFGEYKKESA